MRYYLLVKKDGTPCTTKSYVGAQLEVYRARSAAEKALYSARKKEGDRVVEIDFGVDKI